jgi:hypothetical protein
MIEGKAMITQDGRNDRFVVNNRRPLSRADALAIYEQAW